MPWYPFTPELLDALPEELAELFQALELTLLREICSRLKLSGQLNGVTVQDICALRSHGVDLQAIQQAIADTCGMGLEELDGLLDDVVERNQAYYAEQIDIAQVTAPERFIDEQDIAAIRRQTWSAYRNITGSMGFLAVKGGRLTLLPPAKAYQWALDQAELQVQSGAASYNQAISQAVRQLAGSGLKTVSYESGHVDSVDVAVRRAVMTGVNQLNQKYREQSMDYLETDLVEVTAHAGARDIDGPMGWENHKAWQGKVYRWKAKPRTSKGDYPDFEKTCGYGSVTGIGGANCRHSYWPFIEGISERTYTDEQLENIDPPPFEFEGRTYTAYQATQKQREIERTIRRLKRERAALEAAGLEEDARAVSIKLRRLNEKYRQFSAAAGLPEQWERTRMEFVDEASIMKAPQYNLTQEGEVFDPEIARNSLLERLENSPGLADNIATIRRYAVTTELREEDQLPVAIAYNPAPNSDAILYNPNLTLPAGADRDGILVHELAHRADVQIYNVERNEAWTGAIKRTKANLLTDTDTVQKWFMRGGKYCENPFLSDVVATISKGVIRTRFGHKEDDLLKPGACEREVFANIAALDILDGVDSALSEDVFQDIREIFKAIINGGAVQ